MTPLSIYDEIRASREHHLAKSVRYKLKKANLVLRSAEEISVKQYTRMICNRAKIDMAYIYFIPKACKMQTIR